MPFLGNGVFQVVYNFVNDAANGIKILASRQDTQWADVATNGLSNVVCKDGQSTTTGLIPFAQGISVGTIATITSTSANALTVGPNGATNPTFQVDASTLSSATGIKIKSAAAAAGVNIMVISSGTNEALSLDAKGSGSLVIGGVSTGNVLVATSGSNIMMVGTGTPQAANIVTAAGSVNDGISVLADNTASRGMLACRNPNGLVGSIVTSGSSTAFNTSSDARLKTNIVDAADAGHLIDALRVRAWNWKVDGSFEPYGFVAQEEAIVYAPAVTAGDDSPDEITVPWGRDDSKLVPLLVKEIQSLRRRLAVVGL